MSSSALPSSPAVAATSSAALLDGGGQTISDSWVDLSGHCSLSGPASPNRVTPVPFGGEVDYLRMLKEAQRESNRSSAKVSPISSAIMSLSSTTRNTPSASPKSPPNSPNPELASAEEDFKGVFINRVGGGTQQQQQRAAAAQPVPASELLWDWTSRPNLPSKEWQIPQSSGDTSSRSSLDKSDKKGVYSKKFIYTLLLTNFFSLLIGAGLGMWLSKRSGGGGGNMVEICI
jgi:BCL2/adenovirus E1B protein-interacting protein 3